MTSESKIKAIISDILSICEIDPNRPVVSYANADYLRCAEICMMIEEEFEIELSDYEWADVKTTSEIIEIVESKLKYK